MANPAAVMRARVLADFPDAVVLGRSKNSLEHEVPSIPGKRVLDVSIGPLHFGASEDQEIDTAWQPGIAPWDFEMLNAGYNARALADFSSGQIIEYSDPDSGENINFQPQQLQWTNDLDQIEAIADPQSVNVVVNDDELYWTGAYGADIDLKWDAQPARLDKRLIVQQASALPAPAQFIIDGGNPVLRFQMIFQKTNGLDIVVNDVIWNEKGNNPVETSGLVEFRSKATGLPLWHFNLPRSFHSLPKTADPDEVNEFVGTFRLRKTGPNLFVEHRIPLAWIQSAIYPIEIDATLDINVGASDHDANEQHNNTGFEVTNTIVHMDARTTHSPTEIGGMIFDLTGIANGDTVDVCYITIQCAAQDDPFVYMGFEDVDDADDFTANADIHETRVDNRTSTLITWNADDIGTGDVNSPSLVTPLQEVIDRAGYSAGNAVGAIWEGDDTESSVFRPDSYDGDTGDAPRIHVEYTAAGAAAIPNKVVQVNQAINRAGTY